MDEYMEEMRQREAATGSAASRAERSAARALHGGEHPRAGAGAAQPAADSTQSSSVARGASGKRSATQRTASGTANGK